MISLMITCDDAGLSEGIDYAIIDLHQANIPVNASILTTFPRFTAAMANYAKYPKLDCGLHLNITEGLALTDIMQQSSLVDKRGNFRGREYILRRGLFFGDEIKATIKAEFEAQMKLFVQSGQRVTHITSHHHVHMLPSIAELVYELAEDYGVQWVRNNYLRGAIVPNNLLLNKQLIVKKQSASWMMPNYIVLVMAWLERPVQALLDMIRSLNGIVELVIHPSRPVDDSFPTEILYAPHERHRETRYIQQFIEAAAPYIGTELEFIARVEG